MPFPFDEARFCVHHRVDDQLDQAAIKDSVLLPEIVISQHIPELSLAVAAGSAKVLRD